MTDAYHFRAEGRICGHDCRRKQQGCVNTHEAREPRLAIESISTLQILCKRVPGCLAVNASNLA